MCLGDPGIETSSLSSGACGEVLLKVSGRDGRWHKVGQGLSLAPELGQLLIPG